MSLREAAQQALEALENIDEQELATGDRVWLGKEIGDLRAALSEDVPETNFGNMDQGVDSKEADHIPDATKMMASVREDRMVEPVAYVTGYFDGKCVVSPTAPVVLPTGMALYRLPPKREPLTEEKISAIDWKSGETLHDFARAIERAHGIGGEE